MAWCKLSSLTAAVSRALGDAKFPISRSQILVEVEGKTLEGWDLDYFLGKALTKRRYHDIREVLSDMERWLDSLA
jgi:hypothetical protein